MIEVLPLNKDNIDRIAVISGKSYSELEVMRLAADRNNEVVMFAIETRYIREKK